MKSQYSEELAIPKSRSAENPPNHQHTLFFCAVAARDVSDKDPRNDSEEDERTIAIGLLAIKPRPVQCSTQKCAVSSTAPNSEFGFETRYAMVRDAMQGTVINAKHDSRYVCMHDQPKKT